MSSNGNRSQPNSVRTGGKPDDSPENPNRSDINHGAEVSSGPGGTNIGTNGGSHQESRDHNKHNHEGQSGHKPQAHHSPAEEKH